MKTKTEDFFMRNSELSTEFSKYVLEPPDIDEILTEEKVIIFLPEFDPELKDFNLNMAKDIKDAGGRILTPTLPFSLRGGGLGCGGKGHRW